MAVSIPHCVVRSDRLSLDEDRLRGDCYCEALAFFRHNINLELDEEIMKPEKSYQGAKKLRSRSKYHENEAMMPGTRPIER